MSKPANFAVLLSRFFTDRLLKQRHASPHTVSSYRDTFRLLLLFAKTRIGKEPSQLTLEEINAPLVSAFLDHLQETRSIGARSRNLRLTAIRSFFHYAAFESPAHCAQIQRVLAIPCKRCVHEQVHYLARPEVDALLAAPDRTTWAGHRDHAWLLVMVQTGMRVSELTGLTRQDVHIGAGAYVRIVGKGRKERCTPLSKQTTAVLRVWLKEPARGNGDVMFPNRRGGRLSNDGVQYLLAQHVATACKSCPTLQDKTVSPHVLRHTAAMGLLQSGVDTTLIAMWLGHESVDTTRVYLEADLAMKEKILAKTTPYDGRPVVYKADDTLLTFLQSL